MENLHLKNIEEENQTPKSRLIEKCNSEKNQAIDIDPEDCSEEADSTILVRERVRGSKLESAFKKVKGQIVRQPNNTITVLPNANKKETIYSKRDVATGSRIDNNDKRQKQR